MRIIISPAKKMRVDTDSFPYRNLPGFLPNTKEICCQLQSMSYEELKKLWRCNDQIAQLNVRRLRDMDLLGRLTPAVLAYEGIQYQYMAPGVFTDQEYVYIQEHLRILSGFYGILRPFDGVTPYRLEMQAKLKMGECKDLYAYWGDRLAKTLFAETDCILNLASKEYSVCVSKYLPDSARFITCVFGEEKDGKVIEKGTMCKMARGEMVRFMAQNQVGAPEQVKSFNRLNYHFDESRSDDNTYIFLRETTGETNDDAPNPNNEDI
ncbi:MAG: peroxide stress protein YaaA [Candidatus Faecousia sp.]|nr:peroxide stress protein YaaA [Candidatus Faecousia sp.]